MSKWHRFFLLTLPLILWASISRGEEVSLCTRALTEAPPSVFRIVTFNTQNLHFGDHEKSHHEQRTTEEIKKLADAISTVDPDIAVLQEVDSANEPQYLNNNFFRDRYDVIFKGGNDPGGFEIALLVRKGRAIKYEVETHKHMKWTDPVTSKEIPLFSRDAPALIVYKDADTEGINRPLFVIIGHHAKSKRSNRHDFEGARLRTAQHEAIAKLVLDYKSRFGSDLPVILAGDFNTEVNSAPETESIRQVMTDSFDIINEPLSKNDRVTHTTFKENSREGSYKQLDGILISNNSRVKVLYAGVRRDVSKLAKSYEERDHQISDHFLIYADISVQ
ncbi:MAG: hypothetical protein A2Z20_00685 [Bdellovibrionales bacterium RBG_16_40_8]|nr:MAG: hypothetical protein A2Z20_00685 [Bdellovibrionales bacterium RBG_16_40_8]